MKKEHNDEDIREDVMNSTSDEMIYDNTDESVSDGDDDTSLKEWDFTDDEEIQEFLNHDFDVVAESRRRIQNNQNRARTSRTDRKSKGKEEKTKPRAKKAGGGESFLDKLKELWDKWLETYHKNAMQILFGALAFLVVILVIAIIATYPRDTDNNENAKQETTSSEVESTTEAESEQTTEAEPEIVPETEDSAIHNLITGYIDAAYIQADMDAVALVVDDITNINVESYKSRQKYIELYENIKCYKLESAIENAYIVFVTYDAKLYNIDTLVPSAETFIVKFDQTEGKFFVHNMTEAEKLDGYVAKGSQFEIINKMSAEVLSRLETALASDAELKEVYDLMNNISSQATQSSEEATSSTEETTTAAQ